MRGQFLIVGILLLVTSGVALLMSLRLHAIVSAPLNALARVATAVSSHGDYSLRAARTTDDELGVLVDAFNRMLERIQCGERELSPGQRGSAQRDRRTPPRRTGTRRAAGARARSQPAEGRVSGHAVTRATNAAQRDPRLDQAAAGLRCRRPGSIGRWKRSNATRRPRPAWSRICSKYRESSSGKLRLDIKNVDLIAACVDGD